MIMNDLLQAPAWLDETYHSMWAEVMARRGNRGLARQMLVTQAFWVLQRLHEVTEILNSDGILTESSRSGLQHTHCLLKIEKDLRTQLLKYSQTLGLHSFTASPRPWNGEFD
jgi:phage terminase small subunit